MDGIADELDAEREQVQARKAKEALRLAGLMSNAASAVLRARGEDLGSAMRELNKAREAYDDHIVAWSTRR